jgi:hypothetical protein
MVYYSNLIAINNTSDKFIENLNKDTYQEFLQLTDIDTIIKEFNILSIDNKIKFVEQEYLHPHALYEPIMANYTKMFYKVKELVNAPVINKQPKKGRPKLSECNLKETDKDVYLNTLNLYKETNQHNFINFYINANTIIRIYDESEHVGWRNCTDCENALYKEKLSNINNERFNNLKIKFDGLFGLDIGGVMKIVYNNPEKEEKKKKTKTNKVGKSDKVGRSEPRGRVCTSFHIDAVIDMANKLKINNPNQYTLTDLCPLVEAELKRTNRLF